jgi:hypothetical protein
MIALWCRRGHSDNHDERPLRIVGRQSKAMSFVTPSSRVARGVDEKARDIWGFNS